MLRKTTLAVLGLVIGSTATAGTMGPACIPGNVTVPCEIRQWDIGVQALYLQPIVGNDRAYVTSGFPFSSYYDAEGEWGWGFNLEGSYHFGTGNDFHLNWVHYDVDTNLSPVYFGLSPVGLSTFTVDLNNRFDQVNLVMGQQVDMGLFKNVRFYGGLQYAKFRNNRTRTFVPTAAALAAGITGVTEQNYADFNGVGAVIGADYLYNVYNGLSVTANSAMSLLYGTARNNTRFIYAPSELVALSGATSDRIVVPSLEAKLGLNYAYPMAEGVLNVAAGYEVINYFRALPTLRIDGSVVNSDFGLYGPYVGLNWVGNV